jgi:SAM-dependent methyltransferase
MSDATTQPYDEVPYPSYTYPKTHPDHLHVIGRLLGLDPAPLDEARVLELGAAAGGNLMAMAEQWPRAAFVGIDRSSVQVAEGRALVERVGLANLRLEVRDLMELEPAELGRFDYVIAHGLLSWVPRPVQDRLMWLLPRLLRPQGVAYVSYNAYPGWHLRRGIRDMMLFHTRQFADPRKRVEQARALVEFLSSVAQEPSGPYALSLARERDMLRKMADAHVLHDQLERDNQPLYLYEFLERLTDTGLQYLGDADLHWMVARDLPDEVRTTLSRITGDRIALEQYLDFVRNRQFRSSLVCLSECGAVGKIETRAALPLHFGFQARKPSALPPEPFAPVDLREGVGVEFETHEGAKIHTPAALTKAALVELRERWPATLPLADLVELARARLQASGLSTSEAAERDRDPLARDLIECLLRKAVVARSSTPAHVRADASERPRVSALARTLAAEQGYLVDLHHNRHTLDPSLRMLVPLLDGTRERTTLAASLAAAAKTGAFELLDPKGRPSSAAQMVDNALRLLEQLPALLP